jgi:carbon-monoxide dehydrogenase catalytic subunit
VLKAVGQANGIESLPPVLHMGSCVDNARVADLLNALATKLDVGMKDLPVAGSCPEVQSPKALSIAGYFLCNGVDVHIGVPLPVSGSEVVSKVFTAEKDAFPLTLDGLFGSKLIYEPDMKKAADEIVKRITAKREALGLPAPVQVAV